MCCQTQSRSSYPERSFHQGDCCLRAGNSADMPPGEEPDAEVEPDAWVESDAGAEPDAWVESDAGAEQDAGVEPNAGVGFSSTPDIGFFSLRALLFVRLLAAVCG